MGEVFVVGIGVLMPLVYGGDCVVGRCGNLLWVFFYSVWDDRVVANKSCACRRRWIVSFVRWLVGGEGGS